MTKIPYLCYYFLSNCFVFKKNLIDIKIELIVISKDKINYRYQLNF